MMTMMQPSRLSFNRLLNQRVIIPIVNGFALSLG
jgi:hypothetical protein